MMHDANKAGLVGGLIYVVMLLTCCRLFLKQCKGIGFEKYIILLCVFFFIKGPVINVLCGHRSGTTATKAKTNKSQEVVKTVTKTSNIKQTIM